MLNVMNHNKENKLFLLLILFQLGNAFPLDGRILIIILELYRVHAPLYEVERGWG
jgi:hypothetical protein